jgi:flagellar biogenesis protein FliO
MVEMDYSVAYFKMLLALGGIIAFLLLVKRYVEKKTPLKKGSFKILSQQMIDPKNKLSHIKFKDKEYLIVTGESGFLVDSFKSFENDLKEKIENTNDN